MTAHPDTDHRNLDHVWIRLQRGETDERSPLLQHRHGAVEVGTRHSEGEIGGTPVFRRVLHDHVDIDRVVGERAKYRRRHPGEIRHSLHSYLGFVSAIRDAAYNLLFHYLVFIDHEGSGSVSKARQDLHPHPMVHRHLD